MWGKERGEGRWEYRTRKRERGEGGRTERDRERQREKRERELFEGVFIDRKKENVKEAIGRKKMKKKKKNYTE